MIEWLQQWINEQLAIKRNWGQGFPDSGFQVFSITPALFKLEEYVNYLQEKNLHWNYV